MHKTKKNKKLLHMLEKKCTTIFIHRENVLPMYFSNFRKKYTSKSDFITLGLTQYKLLWGSDKCWKKHKKYEQKSKLNVFN